MIDYTADEILSVLPAPLANDKEICALAAACANQFVKRNAAIKNIEIYMRINQLPESVCDILAESWGLTWYDYNYPLETKRKLIAGGRSVKRRAGTAWAVETVLDSIQKGYTVSDWYEYGGQYGHFKVVFDITDSDIPLSFAEIKKAIERVKRGSAVFDAAAWLIHIECEPYPIGIYPKNITIRFSGGFQTDITELKKIHIRFSAIEENKIKISRKVGESYYFDGEFDFDGHINFG